uniref:RNA polymerase beta'' subunit n=1 Tax=Lygodium flexuosum TaxID=85330 RepID=UPI002A8350F8|nr:RNA polymerase beta'' subunit [Lygodium flexuosum]UYS92448.1 RNA polymerase beta'' subunit [Lygodium flexuosum]
MCSSIILTDEKVEVFATTDQAESPFYNKTMDKTAMRQLINKLIVHFGITYAANILDQAKDLGFQQATKASISLGIDDPSTVSSKGWLVQDAEKQGYISDQYHRYGSLHAVEKLRQSIEAWYATSECLRREMNPGFRIVDPLNPVHMMSFSGARGNTFQVHQLIGMRGPMSDPRGQVIDLPIRRNLREGLSLTEYVISCYGARKGVVDTAVRTSDAGYLTRRLVEVVQHIVVRKKDCETVQSISVDLIGGKKKSIRTISQQGLIGRVLADNVYSNQRCIAVRNQDISDGLASNLVYAKQPIHIRSPLTCRTIFWICQLCYGWSLAHHDLVESGEAVGIIAGQSIGEPGTQLTLRTFHTGGVFTGDIAEYIRTPFNGTIHFDENSVYSTRTRHGHPAWMCRNELIIDIKGLDCTNRLVIPAQSLLMIQNDQYVESQQIIAEVRTREFPLKERILKSIYPNLEGEIHWSRLVRHSQNRMGDTVRIVCDAGHAWVLSGTSNPFDKYYFLHWDQDRIDLSIKPKSHKMSAKSSSNKTYLEIRKEKEVIQKFGPNPKYSPNLSNLLTFTSTLSYSVVNRIEGVVGAAISSLKSKANFDGLSPITFNIQLLDTSTIYTKSRIVAICGHDKYQTSISGIIKYGSIQVEPIRETEFVSGDKTTDTFRLRNKIIGGGNFFLVPEEIYVTHEPPSSLFVANHSLIEEGAQLSPNITSQVSGLVQIKAIENGMEIRILPGYIYHPEKLEVIMSLFVNGGVIIGPGNSVLDEFKTENWIYLQSVVLHGADKPSLLIRPIVEYMVSGDSSTQVSFPHETPETLECIRIQSFMYMLYENDERVEIKKGASIQLVQTHLVIDPQERFSSFSPISCTKNSCGFFTNVMIDELYHTFFHVGSSHNLPATARYNRVFDQQKLLTDLYPSSYSHDKSVVEYRGAIHSVSERGLLPLLLLLPFSLSRIIIHPDLNYGKTVYTNDSVLAEVNYTKGNEKKSLKNFNINLSNQKYSIELQEKISNLELFDSLFDPKENRELGLLGNSMDVPSCMYCPCSDSTPSDEPFHFDNESEDASENRNWYVTNEDEQIFKYPSICFPEISLFNKGIYLSLDSPTFIETAPVKIGLLIGENRYIYDENSCHQSGQVVAINKNYLLVRHAKPYLSTRGATVHKDPGDFIGKGDTLITLPYDRLRSGDIIQGLPKIEQLLESRSIASFPTGTENVFERWNRGVIRSIGNLWSRFVGAGASMEHCQLVLIDQIQKVYGLQGVQVSDKHIEIIVRQLTSKVVLLEDGITTIFLPGELVELSQAQRMNRILKKSIPYKPILLGMTKASLNTTSFLSEASFQETTRVLAKAALRGRIDWLKGLKENVILGDAVPIGTSSQEILGRMDVNKQKEFYSNRKLLNTFEKEVDKQILPDFPEEPGFRHKIRIHEELKHSLSRSEIGMH